MKVEIWSDIVCPFCYIGQRKFEEALKAFPEKEKVEVEFKSYQLDPNTPPYSGQNFYESMAVKFGSVEQSKQMMAGVVEQAKAAGLDFHFDTMKPANTFDAHRLTKFAEAHGKAAIISEKLFYANFTESRDIGDIETLVKIAGDSGLNKEEARMTIKDKQAYAKEVHADIEEAKTLGITGVPSFIFNRKYALSGAQSTEAFTEALEKVLAEENKAPTFETLTPNSDPNGVCDDDGCDLSDQK